MIFSSIFVSVSEPLEIADTPVLEISVSPSDCIRPIKASILCGRPVNSNTKLLKVTSNVFALKVSAILNASTLSTPLATNLINANSQSLP